ncbi:MAG: glycosyltransferase WbuB, partial [Bacteroidales bacterium]|nr:glycosyltransferase WbuB [Candidatus Scybalousia scybalohippi]
MKKILVISEVFYPENFLINDLVREWKKQGHTVDVISQYPSYPESYVFPGYENVGESVEEWEGSKIYRFPFIEGYKTSIKKKFANYLKFVRGASKIGKRIGGNYDVIFVSQTGPLTVAIPAIAIKKKFHKKISIWTFDIWPDVVYMYGVPRMI